MDETRLVPLGKHLQKLRLDRGLSLSRLAQDAGIAKSCLSRLEQGQGNPTLNTIWRLAMQLDMPFGNLVAPMTTPIEHDGVQVSLIDQGMDATRVDVYRMACAPHTNRMAEAHSAHCRERVTIVSGKIEVGPADDTRHLGAGEDYDFPADTPHVYITGDQPACLIVTILYPAESKSE